MIGCLKKVKKYPKPFTVRVPTVHCKITIFIYYNVPHTVYVHVQVLQCMLHVGKTRIAYKPIITSSYIPLKQFACSRLHGYYIILSLAIYTYMYSVAVALLF